MPESRAAMAQRHFLQPHNSASPPPHVGEGFLLVVVLVSIVGTLLAVLGAYWRFSRNSIIVVELADGPDTGVCCITQVCTLPLGGGTDFESRP